MSQSQLQRLATFVNARSARERVLLFVTSAAVLYLVFQLAVFGPLDHRQDRDMAQVAQLEKENRALVAQVTEKLALRTGDPNRENLRLKMRLDNMIGDLDRQIAGIVQGLIKPQEMTSVLQEIIQKNPKLHMVSIENLPTEPLVPGKEGERPSGIYLHGVRIIFEADYFSAVDYLKRLQALPWRLYWDELSVETVKYPTARFILVVRTLSLSEGWIGV